MEGVVLRHSCSTPLLLLPLLLAAHSHHKLVHLVGTIREGFASPSFSHYYNNQAFHDNMAIIVPWVYLIPPLLFLHMFNSMHVELGMQEAF